MSCPVANPPADAIVTAQRIWTNDPDQRFAEALAIRSGAIVAVGTRAEVEALAGPKTLRLDHPEGFVVPGLIDAHAHLVMLGESLEEIDLRDAASPEEVARRVAQRLRERGEIPPDRRDHWILGRNWDQSLWEGMAFPTAQMLDAVAPDRPVWLRRVDAHAAWGNSHALKLAGITRDTQPPPDGQILRDEHGEPTGVFIDGAMDLVERIIPPRSEADLERAILRAQDHVVSFGLTGVHDARVTSEMEAAFDRLERRGDLKLRVYGMASPPEGGEVEFVTRPPTRTNPNARFRLRAVKLFMDGAMGSRGALMFEEYADDPGNVGLRLVTLDVLDATVTEALKHGWQVCVHAIGDRANAELLDAFENGLRAVPQARDPRLRVEHAQVVRRADVPRFRQSGIIASMQPAHAGTDQRWADLRLGEARAQGAYAWSWFVEEQVHLAFGSDFPVEIADPLWGIYAALTRKNERGQPPDGWRPEHRLDLETTLQGFTSGAAYASFDEDRLGRLKPGFRADLVVFDRDFFDPAVTPEQIRHTRVLRTMIDGETVFLRHRQP
ncbi:Amidohydrolase 3 [Isosphaera pallida ATCC 43644]|uniref:Amidohydrolase 3 n=1 Tax=Isosphaera pallida (strain ATCC 43644 / DSM 9630 / IS1B) TaxID=575540 RepID=E8R5S9_ISOPI|nr:amidohydrolase [Isosphaera pallida]ADV62836.1 Amidohydrolase 3 [Isosphaera pallida ATCC 43644]